MNLEDHWGDIISKARTSANVSAEDAAAASGLSLDEFSALEETGKLAKRPNFQALAGRLGLHAAKLERIANGWLPQSCVMESLIAFKRAGADGILTYFAMEAAQELKQAR